jgi:hypothetical protein
MKTKSILLLSTLLAVATVLSQEPPPQPRHGPDGEAPGRPPRREPGAQKYSIEQAASDRAQLHTIAFSGLAFITGDFGASTFIPPGKVCDYFGFQYMRDIDAAQKGHNPMFLNRVAGNVFHVLNENQKQLFADLAGEQAPQLEELAKLPPAGDRGLLAAASTATFPPARPRLEQGGHRAAITWPRFWRTRHGKL